MVYECFLGLWAAMGADQDACGACTSRETCSLRSPVVAKMELFFQAPQAAHCSERLQSLEQCLSPPFAQPHGTPWSGVWPFYGNRHLLGLLGQALQCPGVVLVLSRNAGESSSPQRDGNGAWWNSLRRAHSIPF